MALEGTFPLDDLGAVLSERVRFSCEGRTFTEGIGAVCALIGERQRRMPEVAYDIVQVLDYGDGCLKVDFRVVGSNYQVLVRSMYYLEDGKITDIFEAWPPVGQG